jgi:hypothetical protein
MRVNFIFKKNISFKKIKIFSYTSRTKAVLAMTILTALSLGIMVFISHIISNVKFDYILKWLFPISFGLLSFSILCIIITLAIFSGTRYQDINELIYSSSLVSASLKNRLCYLFI